MGALQDVVCEGAGVSKPQVKASEARNAAGQITKGHTGNPGGQPKWVNEVKSALETCASEGAAFLLSIIRGEATAQVVTREGDVIEVGPSHENRLRAVDIALAYTMPKPKQQVEVSGTIAPRPALQALPDSKYDALTEAALNASPDTQH